MSTKKEIETTTVATRITKAMFNGIQTVLTLNSHINTADYLRDLIRRDLEERDILPENESKSSHEKRGK